MLRYVLLWTCAGALVAVVMYLLGSWLDPSQPIGLVWLTTNVLIDPSWLLGISTYYEVPMGSYGARRVATLAAFNTPFYAALGWTLWMAKHKSSWFTILAAIIITPFAIAALVVGLSVLGPYGSSFTPNPR